MAIGINDLNDDLMDDVLLPNNQDTDNDNHQDNDTPDNDNNNNIGLPEGSNIADTLDKRLTVMLNQYYGDFKNIYSVGDEIEVEVIDITPKGVSLRQKV